jgi:hypothetical protein
MNEFAGALEMQVLFVKMAMNVFEKYTEET